ncbi:unnamed protein product [Phytophthora lilii]|uniref:Unnamed protein product n=1 Tax=Phytophthora lilii TaxID=2077276 RepID=A0A9W6UE32_9STRA|nr:unnamed protein product [Phytophthora lilii]
MRRLFFVATMLFLASYRTASAGTISGQANVIKANGFLVTDEHKTSRTLRGNENEGMASPGQEIVSTDNEDRGFALKIKNFVPRGLTSLLLLEGKSSVVLFKLLRLRGVTPDKIWRSIERKRGKVSARFQDFASRYTLWHDTTGATSKRRMEAVHFSEFRAHDQIYALLLAQKHELEASKANVPVKQQAAEIIPDNKMTVERVLVRQTPIQRNHVAPVSIDEDEFSWSSTTVESAATPKVKVEPLLDVKPHHADTLVKETTPLAQISDLTLVMTDDPLEEDNLSEDSNNTDLKKEASVTPVSSGEAISNSLLDENSQTVEDNVTAEKTNDNEPALVPIVAEDMEVVESVPERQLSISLSTDFSAPLLIQMLGSGEGTAQQNEHALLLLICKCTTNSNRVQVFKAGGIPVLVRLVREGESLFTQLYALHCLSWFTFVYSKMRESDLEVLKDCSQDVEHADILTLLQELQQNHEKVKEAAAIRCSCLATHGDGDKLRDVGVLPVLVTLIKDGTSNQKLWAAEALVTLASDNKESCEAITREGAIPPLVALLRSGTDMQKQEASYALGNLAANNEVSRGKITREGAIPPMEGAIDPLVALLRTGTRAQKQWAAYTLGNLAHNDANRMEITQQGAISLLVKLLRTGTAMQKQRAAFALGNLACDNPAATNLEEAILPLVELVRTGSDSQKEDAAYTLGNIAASNNDRRLKIGQTQAITLLAELVRTGMSDQKQWSAYALGCLAKNNDMNRAAIVEAEVVAPLVNALG